MFDDVSVVISAAGQGTRLGKGLPKALVEVEGIAILERQLVMLPEELDVIVAVGFRQHDVMALARERRPSTRFVFNEQFATTGTASSLGLAAQCAKSFVVLLDGDVLARRADLFRVITSTDRCLGLGPPATAAPIWAAVDERMVVSLSQDVPTEYEWSGLVKIEREVAMALGTGHVYTGLRPMLPIRALDVDSVEVDDLDDLERAHRWAREAEESE